MDNIDIRPILPLPLQRRINRLIQIDDVLNENLRAIEQINLLDENVSMSLDNRIYVEPRIKPKPLHDTKTNWIDEYSKKVPKERVIWDSKLYSDWKDFNKKTMYEQIEDLIDISAQDFAECINKLTDDEQHQISKEMIKNLFSIEIESDLARAMYIQKSQRPVVPHNLAELFQCPERCIERNIREMMKEKKKLFKIKPRYHAFGRCLSPASKREMKDRYKKPEPLDFPDDIRSGENLFHGIDHLKATQSLLKYLEEKKLPKPSYLVKVDALNSKRNEHLRTTPLHTFYQ